jgi:hypothetical protein
MDLPDHEMYHLLRIVLAVTDRQCFHEKSQSSWTVDPIAAWGAANVENMIVRQIRILVSIIFSV